jgi:hypothetical protein
MWEGSPDRPVGAIYLARDGRVTVGAAGATNTSGKGGPRHTAHGTIPLDSANKYVISIEAANNGVGEPWPTPQINAYIKMCAALCTAYGIGVGDCHAHFEWTSRKIDPAGNSKYATGGNSWDMNLFRSDVFNNTIPPPDPGDDDMTDAQLKAITDRLDKIVADTHLLEVRMDYLANDWCRKTVVDLDRIADAAAGPD